MILSRKKIYKKKIIIIKKVFYYRGGDKHWLTPNQENHTAQDQRNISNPAHISFNFSTSDTFCASISPNNMLTNTSLRQLFCSALQLWPGQGYSLDKYQKIMTIRTYRCSEWYSSILKIYKKVLFSAPFMTYTKTYQCIWTRGSSSSWLLRDTGNMMCLRATGIIMSHVTSLSFIE